MAARIQTVERYVSRAMVREVFAPHVGSRNKRMCAKARRAVLALAKGGACNNCGLAVDNYWEMYFWHFDHLFDVQDHAVSPLTGIQQFRISGNDCVNRSWRLVKEHAMRDTQLLCADCHWEKNQLVRRDRERVATLTTMAAETLAAILP